MEVQDSSEAPNLKTRSRSRSSSKELAINDHAEVIEDDSETLGRNSDSDLPNGAEHHETSKDGQEEEDEEDDNDHEDVETNKITEVLQNDGNNENLPKEVPVVESPEDSSLGESPVEQEKVDVKEENCDINVKEGSNFEDGESDTGSENWNLNIDTSGAGSSGPSEQAGSEREDIGEETGSVKKETPTQDDDEYQSSAVDFLGFDGETSSVLSILKRIIEKLELESSESEGEDNDWDSSCDNDDVAGNTPQKMSSLSNHDDVKPPASTRWSLKSSKESFEASFNNLRDRSPGRLEGGNPDNAGGEASSIASSSPSLSSAGPGRGKKVHVDVSNPAFRKPMEFGWKRELVYRNTSDSSGHKRMADIYYYTPLGKKVRSNREVLENLIGEELTVDNFTFFKEPLGLDDRTKEIIRDAKRASNKEPIGAPPKKLAKLSKLIVAAPTPTKDLPPSEAATPEQPGEDRQSPSAKPVVVVSKDAASTPSSKEPSPLPAAAAPSPKPKPTTRAFPRVKVTPLRNQRKLVTTTTTPTSSNTTPNSKATVSSRPKKDPNKSGELVMGMLPPLWKDPTALPINKKSTALAASSIPQVAVAPSTGTKAVIAVTTPAPASTSTDKSARRASTTKKGKKMESPCSIQCLGMMGIIPSLQCHVCLCLYHPECVGLGTITETIHCYVCKKCQQTLKEEKLTTLRSKLVDASSGPPPLTPISTLGSASSSGHNSGTTSSVPSTSSGSTPPKLQRLPHTNNTTNKLQTVPHLVRVTCQDVRPGIGGTITTVPPGSSTLVSVSNKKTNIVGSVTTWLPSSSTIQINPTASVPYKTADTATSSKVQAAVVAPSSIPEADAEQDPTDTQGLLKMEGRRYIIVQRHNVLSVSPPAAPTPAPKLGATLGEGTSFAERSAPFALGAGGIVLGSLPPPSASTINRQGLVTRPQILLTAPGITIPSGPRLSTPSAVTSTPILPKPFLVGPGSVPRLQNPPGLLLVPINSPIVSGTGGEAGGTTQQQFMLVTTPSPGFLFGNLQTPQQRASSTSTPATITTASTGTKMTAVKETKEVESKPTEEKKNESERQYMQFFMQNMSAGYFALVQVFHYLKVQELLRAARVCRMWKDLATQPSLWHTVRMKNSQVVDWKGCAQALKRYGTVELDLRKMLIPNRPVPMWDEFCSVVGTISSLRRLELCKCPVDVLDRIASECPQLQSLTALSIKCSSIHLNFVHSFNNIQELRLKSVQGIDLQCSLEVLKNLTNLKHLALTTFKELGRKDPNVLGNMPSLETLELGDFCDFPESFGQSLINLKNLQRLRLEKGQGKMCPTFKVLAGVRALPRLTQLELVNFDIKPGFDAALEQCTNIRRLLIIPTYVSQSATTNHMVLGGVTKLSESLVQFVWGVTHELLRVTELFVDQCEGQKGARVTPKDSKKNGTSDSIPVLKPVPGLVADVLCENGSDSKSTDSKQKSREENAGEDTKSSAATQQVDILPLSKLQMLLTNALPNTKVKILKIPFHATWRQSMGEHGH